MRKVRQYFNDIPYTDIPFYISISILTFFFFFVVYVRKYMSVTPAALVLLFLLLFMCIIRWFSDVLSESSMRGRYGKKLRAALVCGFFLFLCSEIMLFGGFFWALFDRAYTPAIDVGYWMPAGMQATNHSALPLVGTCVLIASGYFVNESYYLLKASEFWWHLCYGYIAIALALCFLIIQAVEYAESGFAMSHSIYGSCFYILTGFHGLHVTVGLLFLLEQYERVHVEDTCIARMAYTGMGNNASSTIHLRHADYMTFEEVSMLSQVVKASNHVMERRVAMFDSDHHVGLILGIVYWHFVDIIWIFLFLQVYVFNSVEDMESLLLVRAPLV